MFLNKGKKNGLKFNHGLALGPELVLTHVQYFAV